MIVKRVGPLSFARIGGTLYALLGLLGGVVFAMVTAASGLVSRGHDTSTPWGMGLGLGAVVLFPILYGAIGFVGCLLCAWLYNVLAGLVGGIEIEVQ